jgi:hypothetical protein
MGLGRPELRAATSIAVATIVAVVGVMPAAADTVAEPLAEHVRQDLGQFAARLAGRSLQRLRRSVTLGPIAAAAPALGGSGDADLELTFGIGLFRYDVAFVPSIARVKEILAARVRALIRERLAAAATGSGPLSEAQRAAIVEQSWQKAWDEVKAELSLELQPRHLEPPAYAALLEVSRWTSSDAWHVRAALAIGLGPVYVAAGLGVRLEDGAYAMVPLEISLPILLTSGLRSPLISPLVRLEVAASDRGNRADQVLVGARVALDVL